MIKQKSSNKLRKELKLIDVFAISTGATLSSGFFLLPGLIAEQVGPSIVLSYLLATIPLIPAMFSVIELSTAMPRAGGVYFFLDRTLGPYFGTIGGIGTWFSLVLKVSFALVGMGAYIKLFIPMVDIKFIALIIAVFLGILSIFGAKKSSRFQVILVLTVLSVISVFLLSGVTQINIQNFDGFFNLEFSSILSTAGIVYVSYMGLTKIASLSEEIQNPEKNISLGILLSTLTAVLVYGIGTSVMVGVIPMEKFLGDLTPVASVADILFGKIGVVIISIAAMLAFISVANAGILGSSRYPMAMGRDHIFPVIFRKLTKYGTPVYSIFLTMTVIILFIVFLDPLGIAKLASAFQLLMFVFVCLAVIVMRESGIQSYDPGYKSPLYPWLQIIGIIAPLILIYEMGVLTILFSIGLIAVCSIWYFQYARKRVMRSGAIYHVFEKLGRQRYDGLDSELRGILKEKGLRKNDPFDEIIARSIVFDLNESQTFEDLISLVAKSLSQIVPLSPNEITTQIMEGTQIGATPVTHGVALPHFRSDAIDRTEMVLVRCLPGVSVPMFNPLTHQEEDKKTVHAIFFLVSPEKNPTQHLRILAQIAGRVDEDGFIEEWKNAKGEQELKESLLHDDNFLSLCLRQKYSTDILIGKPLKELPLPSGCLVALLRRGNHVIVPNGNTIFSDGDRLTIIGNPKIIKTLENKYSDMSNI